MRHSSCWYKPEVKRMDATGVMEDRVPSLEGLLFKESFFSSLFDSAIFGFALYDRDLRYLSINHTLAAMNGLPAADHVGRRFQDVLPNLAREVSALYELALETGRPM